MPRGYSLLELLVVITIVVIVAGMATPILSSSVDYSRAAGAARYLSGLLAVIRMEAVKRSAYVALRFDLQNGRYQFTTFADGNANGIKSVDIANDIDVPLGRSQSLDDQFPGVTFGVYPDVQPVASGDSLTDGDPIKVGQSNLLSFSPLGSATSGTLYIRGRGKQQFAVRVLGITGRVTVLRFDFANGSWSAP